MGDDSGRRRRTTRLSTGWFPRVDGDRQRLVCPARLSTSFGNGITVPASQWSIESGVRLVPTPKRPLLDLGRSLVPRKPQSASVVSSLLWASRCADGHLLRNVVGVRSQVARLFSSHGGCYPERDLTAPTVWNSVCS